MTGPLWTPSSDRTARTRLHAFQRFVAARHDIEIDDYDDLHRWSIEHPGEFWTAVWDDCGVVGTRGERPFVPGGDLRSARFFPDARLNVAENLLSGDPESPAIVYAGEDGQRRTLTRAELGALVSRVAQALVVRGVGPGDRVAAWLPNIPEAYAVMLASAAIGAVYSSTSPDFGTAGVLDRFGQIEPAILFAADGYFYAGRSHDCLGRLAEIRAGLPTVGEVVVVTNRAEEPDLGAVPDAVAWDAFCGTGDPGPVPFTPLPFDHPWYILYSSGTTGVPKCIVHRAGGVLLMHLKEHQLHCDVHPGDRVFYFTTTGWMMWNWLASALASEATIVVYDGSPTHPSVTSLFDLVDEAQITLFGTSAKFIESLGNAGVRPRDTHDLSTIRTITSTGSPLVAEGFEIVYDRVKADVHLASISGGTDLCGCLVAGDPTAAVRAGEIQVAALGLDTVVVDDDGVAIDRGRGELVCRTPFPSMPLRFWDDPGDQRYAAAYFERFPGIWHQGDYAERTESGGFVIHGRSDATLNPGGVRIGTAEIYRQVDRLDEVIEALVVGQERGGDSRIVLFVRLREGLALDEALEQRIRSAIREGASPRHVPAVVAQVDDIPRTRSGKIVELAVREVIHDRPIANVEAIANPEALDHFRDRPELA